jgi:hypothetical protein
LRVEFVAGCEGEAIKKVWGTPATPAIPAMGTMCKTGVKTGVYRSF